jgi:hypothetical protein
MYFVIVCFFRRRMRFALVVGLCGVGEGFFVGFDGCSNVTIQRKWCGVFGASYGRDRGWHHH